MIYTILGVSYGATCSTVIYECRQAGFRWPLAIVCGVLWPLIAIGAVSKQIVRGWVR
jgi:hypothetical protein